MSEVLAWPKATGVPAEPPTRIMRPCDYGMLGTLHSLETQLGTIEAYNRVVEAANHLKTRIDAGYIKPQNPLFATHIQGG